MNNDLPNGNRNHLGGGGNNNNNSGNNGPVNPPRNHLGGNNTNSGSGNNNGPINNTPRNHLGGGNNSGPSNNVPPTPNTPPSGNHLNNLSNNSNNVNNNTPPTPPSGNNLNLNSINNTPMPETPSSEPARGVDDNDGMTGMEALNQLIGLGSVKETIDGFRAFLAKNKGNKKLNVHMCFTGNPGTGKTAVARLVGRIFYEEGILPTKTFIEGDRATLVKGYIGQTAQNVHDKVQEAMGGVLFIDEAYTLARGDDGQDFGHEAVQALLKDMEDFSGKFCCILAGYTEPTQQMIATNPGFKSRIAYFVDFPDYSVDELKQILNLFLKKDNYTMEEAGVNKLLEYIKNCRLGQPDFANAREIRESLQKIEIIQAIRTSSTQDDRTLTLGDVEAFVSSNDNDNINNSGNVSHKAYKIF